MSQRTIIIAEVGECFNGDMGVAKRLIKAAKEAGCDYVKFQTLDRKGIARDDPEREWFLKIALTENQLETLREYSRGSGIGFLCTPENKKKAQVLKRLRFTEIKIASCSLTDDELVDYAGKNFSRVFLSTGMASLGEIQKTVAMLSGVKELFILHCISEYPTGPLLEKRGLKALSSKDVRFNMMKMLMELYPGRKVGYSDHTSGILAPVVAVALGAQVIEKHVTLDRKTPVENFRTGREYLGTDHVLSVEPEELKEMVRNIREVETMFGPQRWERSGGEKLLREFLRGRFKHNEEE